jgi:3-dehydroquinate synthase
MNKLIIQGTQSKSTILVGESFKNFKKYLPNKQVIIITDDKVRGLYGEYFNDYPIIEIGQTEQIKTLATVETIFEQLLVLDADRGSFILAVGGGIVCEYKGVVPIDVTKLNNELKSNHFI